MNFVVYYLNRYLGVVVVFYSIFLFSLTKRNMFYNNDFYFFLKNKNYGIIKAHVFYFLFLKIKKKNCLYKIFFSYFFIVFTCLLRFF